MNRPRIGFTSTPLIFSLPATTPPVCTAPKWSESVNEVDSDCELSKCGVCQLVPVLSWLLHNPDRLPADWSPPVYRLAHLPGFQATRLPSSSPRVAADNLHCTPTLCRANWTTRFKLWIFFTCFTREKMAQFSRAQSKRGGGSKLASWQCRQPSVYLPDSLTHSTLTERDS